MQAIFGIAIIIAIGWVIVAILPVILPLLGFLVVGAIGLMILAAIFGK